jgi:hypothetical protein|nr:MAG TPA: hypothetical protein [Bacteriophage sp.]
MNSVRSLSVAEYFHVIQREYLMAEFRRKIYFSPKDKRYFSRVMEFKREKICDIANRNKLTSIFTSPEKMRDVRAELFDPLNRPMFAMSPKDWMNYYSVNSDFSYRGEVWKLDAVKGDFITLYNERSQVYADNVPKSEVIRVL